LCVNGKARSGFVRLFRRRATPEEWEHLDEDGLERLVMERWLFRGGMIFAMFVLALLITFVVSRGLATFADQVLVGVMAVLVVASGITLATMRAEETRIHRELHRRRAKR
jgi:hypothetical protein